MIKCAECGSEIKYVETIIERDPFNFESYTFLIESQIKHVDPPLYECRFFLNDLVREQREVMKKFIERYLAK